MDIYLKREDQSEIGSFKLRGAYNNCFHTKLNHVWTASAGNHAQGVARAMKLLNGTATIVMPRNVLQEKLNRVLSLGAKVILHGNSFEEAERYAFTQFSKTNYIPPFNSELTIDGTSILIDELASQKEKPFDYIFCPVGGGGLMTSILRGLKRHFLNTEVIGVEQYLNNSMWYSIQRGLPSRLSILDTFCDGTAVSKPGVITFNECKDNRFHSVTKDNVIRELRDFYHNMGEFIEPSAALSIAGMRKHFRRNPDEKKPGNNICLLITGKHVSDEVKDIITKINIT